MSRYRLMPRAQADLRSIAKWYRTERSASAARKTSADIRAQIRNLAEHPGIGHGDEELGTAEHRFWAYRQFLIVYLADTDPLAVVTIWDARRGDPGLRPPNE